MRIKCWVAGLFVLWAFPSLAWWDVGHEVVGEIAWMQLDQKTREKVDELLKQLTPIYAEALSLAASAKLPDHMRTGFKVFDAWHYIDLPQANMSTSPNPTDEHNIVWALCQSIRNLMRSGFEKSDQNPFAFRPKLFEQAFMLPFLAHFVGDLHQPLHALTRYSPMFPYGDNGGNLFMLKIDGKPTSLHMLWDTGVGAFDHVHDKYQPTEKKTPRAVEIAKNLVKQFPKSHFGKKVEEVVFRAWAQESHELAKKLAYDLAEGSEPSLAYIKKGQEVSKERVALAGYRLAYILTQALDEKGRLLTGCSR